MKKYAIQENVNGKWLYVENTDIYGVDRNIRLYGDKRAAEQVIKSFKNFNPKRVVGINVFSSDKK